MIKSFLGIIVAISCISSMLQPLLSCNRCSQISLNLEMFLSRNKGIFKKMGISELRISRIYGIICKVQEMSILWENSVQWLTNWNILIFGKWKCHDTIKPPKNQQNWGLTKEMEMKNIYYAFILLYFIILIIFINFTLHYNASKIIITSIHADVYDVKKENLARSIYNLYKHKDIDCGALILNVSLENLRSELYHKEHPKKPFPNSFYNCCYKELFTIQRGKELHNRLSI